VVEDDPELRVVLRSMLDDAGFEVHAVDDGPSALHAAADPSIDLMLLDLNLPSMDGHEVLRQLRATSLLPVIVLSGQTREADRVAALDRGADDYLIKPCSGPDLAAHIRAVLRRAHPTPDRPPLVSGPLRIDPRAREVDVAGARVPLTTREYELLIYLASRPQIALSREELLQQVWRSASGWQDPETVTEHVRRVRRKLAEAGLEADPITTLRGYGYRFDPL
jgi:DNA-binding response OmpR family regulator